MKAIIFLGILVNGLGMFNFVIGVTHAQEAPGLPTGPVPVQIIAQMTEKGSLTLVIPYTEFVREDANDGTRVIRVLHVRREETRTVSLKELKVYKPDGKELDLKHLPELLAKPIPALCSADGKLVDPLHLRLVKDGTLIFVGPTPKPLQPITVVP